jgi:outer membrane protein assembly factor BamB
MIKRGLIVYTTIALLGGAAMAAEPQWYSWRGPNQNGTSDEKYTDWSFNEKPLWTYKLQGRGNPVIADGQLYSFGYHGSGPDFSETLTALDAKTGKLLWEVEVNDYVSDTAYSRYGVGSPTVDPETGNIYLAMTNGHFIACDKTGKVLWQHSMIERFGRLTFPNGRSGCVLIEGNTAIVRCISSYWGKEGPARDRFYAFDKLSGEPVWSSEPGIQPQDSSFSTPIFETRDGRRVFYTGTGCGNMVCVNAANGVPLWRWRVSKGGVNASPVIYKNMLICIHDAENMDSSDTGRMFAIKLPEDLDNTGGIVNELEGGAPALPASAEVWRNPLKMFTSSPVLVGNRVYQIVATGELVCVNADDGTILWSQKLGPDNIHSSPLAVDGKLIVPINEGDFYIIEPSDEGAKILNKVELEGNCLGAPTVCNGYLYIHTTEQLYCWKFGASKIEAPEWPKPEMPAVGKPVGLLAIPNDVTMAPGTTQAFRLFSTDANGFVTGTVDKAAWKSFIPPTAKVKSEMDAAFNESGALVTKADAKVSAGAFMGIAGEVKGTMRGRALPTMPYTEDFEGYELPEDHPVDKVKFAYPPLPWIGARFKWEIREVDGTKAMAKTLDKILFQRAITYIGHEDQSDYVLQADVMTDGNRRVKSDVGLINQRYVVVLKGNANEIEISSNYERIRVAAPFTIKPNVWYRLKTQVDVKADGSGLIRGKAWERDQAEPEGWNIEFNHNRANTSGSPGLFGFSPQSQKRVFIDNISITPNPNKK